MIKRIIKECIKDTQLFIKYGWGLALTALISMFLASLHEYGKFFVLLSILVSTITSPYFFWVVYKVYGNQISFLRRLPKKIKWIILFLIWIGSGWSLVWIFVQYY